MSTAISAQVVITDAVNDAKWTIPFRFDVHSSKDTVIHIAQQSIKPNVVTIAVINNLPIEVRLCQPVAWLGDFGNETLEDEGSFCNGDEVL